MKILFVRAFAALIAAAALVFTAAPAQADGSEHATDTVVTDVAVKTAGDCIRYLDSKGYVIGENVHQACNQAAAGGSSSDFACYLSLRSRGVEADHAEIACFNRA